MSAPARILVVDDHVASAEGLAEALVELGYETAVQHDAGGALAVLRDQRFDTVITDLRMYGLDGLGLLREVRLADDTLPVLLVSGHASDAHAVERAGAFAFLTKPLDLATVEMHVRSAVAARRLGRTGLPGAPPATHPATHPALDGAILGRSEALHVALQRADRAAASDASVLLNGETGTGKELFARRIHARSPRAARPFVVVNAGAIPESLIEAELFGHVRGAFTGAVADRAGVFEAAHTGTLFLDEIGELAAAAQTRLLRVLQEGVVRRVGETRDRPVDVRIIAATHRDIAQAADFRPDLYFRLAVIPIDLPPLRARGGDTLLLFGNALLAACRRADRAPPILAGDAVAALERHAWPGNVRELTNLAERVAVLAPGPTITAADLGLAGTQPASDTALPPGDFDLTAWLEGLEEGALRRALDRCGGVKAHAAASLGLERNAFRYKLKKYGLGG